MNFKRQQKAISKIVPKNKIEISFCLRVGMNTMFYNALGTDFEWMC